jgi:hypothetical protein
MGQTQRRDVAAHQVSLHGRHHPLCALGRGRAGIVRVSSALQPELVRAWVYQRLADGVSAATLKQEVCGIGKAARIAGRGTAAAWTALVRELPRRVPPPSRAYGPDGARLVDQVAIRSSEAGLALRFIQETGARIGSVVRTGEPGEHRLLAEQIHVDGQPGFIHLEGKGGRTRRAPVCRAVRAPGTWPRQAAERAVRHHRRHLRYELQLAGEALGIPTRGRSVHGFRYDYAVRLQQLASGPPRWTGRCWTCPPTRADYERLRAAWRDDDAIDRIVSEELCHSRVAITTYYQR